ncbi:MAG: 16S rRNA (cytosine(1402)-N(4))-methyltransferase RsmH [Parcubacteria group bacterium]|jgi:16S rRNA (cytosine1402-N4)-methyltransferase
MIHKPVLLGEVIENLKLKKGDVAVDGTLGAGGHSTEILKKIVPGGKLIAIDWDEKPIQAFQKRVGELDIPISKRELILVNGNYADIENILRGLGLKSVNALFLDLGFSSDQIDDPKRGFSFRKDGPLDMRYSKYSGISAADVVNKYPERGLEEIFRQYGEEKKAKRVAQLIVSARRARKIESTQDLVRVIAEAFPAKHGNPKMHFATKVFQALRMEVNQEIPNLKKFLNYAPRILASEGRLAVISFHSIEDRIVKQFFQREAKKCICPDNFLRCGCNHQKQLKIVTRKPITPANHEISANPRSRSAKLRVAEKI